MQKQRKSLYRYRTCADYYLKQTFNNQIGCSLFKTFSTNDELNYTIVEDDLIRIGFGKERINRSLKKVLNSINNRYYLACFTYNSPEAFNINWKNYGDNGCGYCIEYDQEDLIAAVDKESLLLNKRLHIKEVLYTDKKFDLSPLLKSMIKSGLYSEEFSDENERRFIEDYSTKMSNPDLGSYITHGFTRKKLENKPEREVRIIMQSRWNNPKEKYLDDIITCKPKAIICTNKANQFLKSRLKHFCEENSIEFRFVEI